LENSNLVHIPPQYACIASGAIIGKIAKNFRETNSKACAKLFFRGKKSIRRQNLKEKCSSHSSLVHPASTRHWVDDYQMWHISDNYLGSVG
jgi:hypothetical protein